MRAGTGWLLAAVLSVAGIGPASAQDHPDPAPEREQAPKGQPAQPRRRPPLRRSVVIVLQDSNSAPTDAPRHPAHLSGLPQHLPPWVRALLEQHGPPGEPAWVDGETGVEITSADGPPSDGARAVEDLDFDVELLWSDEADDEDDDDERPNRFGRRPWIFTVQTPGRVVQSTRLEDLNRALRGLQLPPMTEQELEELVTLAPDEESVVIEMPEGCAEECTPPSPELPERMRTLHHFLQQMHDRLERIERRAASSDADDDDDEAEDDEDHEDAEDEESTPDAPAKDRQGPY